MPSIRSATSGCVCLASAALGLSQPSLQSSALFHTQPWFEPLAAAASLDMLTMLQSVCLQAPKPLPSIFACFACKWLPGIASVAQAEMNDPANNAGLHYLLVDVCLMLLSWDALFSGQEGFQEIRPYAVGLLSVLVGSCICMKKWLHACSGHADADVCAQSRSYPKTLPGLAGTCSLEPAHCCAQQQYHPAEGDHLLLCVAEQ